MGASPAQAASGLMAVSVAMGLCAIVLSLRHRMPISIAWSTPGAALLASSATPETGFAGAVGAFLLCGVLMVVAGIWRPLGRWVAAIPAPLANAMLAGVLLGLGLGCGQPLSMILTHAYSPDGRAGEAMGLRITANKIIQVAVPLVFGFMGGAFGLFAVFWSNAVLLALGGYVNDKGDAEAARKKP